MTAHASAPIGVFDSGIGGLSILQALRKVMPHERFVYFADTRHNPYGVKPLGFVRGRSLEVARDLVMQHQIKALVVACNTATAAAITDLRQAYPDLPIVGVEPALKTAAAATRSGQVLVLATRGTLESDKFALLKASLEASHADRQTAVRFTCVPCDGLADRIEQLCAYADRAQGAADLAAYCEPFIRSAGRSNPENASFDTLVLGCTHYPLIRDVFRRLVPHGVTIVDNAQPVAQRCVALLSDRLAPVSQTGGVLWLSSGDPDALRNAAQYWAVAAAT